MKSEKNKKKKNKLDEFHYHEALDRTYLIGSMVNDTLTTHPVYKKHKKLKKKINKVEDLLAELYQEMGDLEHTLFNTDEHANKN